ALVLAQILQFADAAFDLLLWRLRHSWQLRNFASRPPSLARLRAARSQQRRDPVRPGATRRHGRDHDLDSVGSHLVTTGVISVILRWPQSGPGRATATAPRPHPSRLASLAPQADGRQAS